MEIDGRKARSNGSRGGRPPNCLLQAADCLSPPPKAESERFGWFPTRSLTRPFRSRAVRAVPSA